MAIRIKAGVIVQISSIKVPWLWYLCTIPTLLLLNLIIVTASIQNTRKLITIK
jgi:hypothetical protein